jgi:integrase
LAITIHPKLREIIDAQSKQGLQLIVTESGKPFSDAGFGNKFRRWCDEAGLPNCTAHGLRKAAATRLAEAGCTEQEIMAITGHKTSKQVSVYTKKVDRVRLADTGIGKLVAGENGNRSVPLSDHMEKGGTLSRSKALKS